MDANARPGWYAAPEGDGRQRYWTGERWEGPALRPPAYSPVPLMAIGFVGLLVGGVLTSVGTSQSDNAAGEVFAMLGFAVLAAAGLVILVGAIAAGVRLGHQHIDWDKRR